MIFYTGSYTEKNTPVHKPMGEGLCRFSFDDKKGRVKLLSKTNLRNPIYMTISNDNKFLYVIEEVLEHINPKVYSYSIDDDGNLTNINSQIINGSCPCHLSIVGTRLLVANYNSGSVVSFEIEDNGGLKESHQTIQLFGVGYNIERQDGPHIHMVQPKNDESFFLVDLGLDIIKEYKFEFEKWVHVPQSDLTTIKGAGPRHMVLDETKKTIYLLSELSGDIYIFHRLEGYFSEIQRISSVPENFRGIFYSSAIKIHPNGNFLYAACRGSDTIALYRIDYFTKKLTLISHESSFGRTPIDFAFHPSGKWLIATNQESNDIIVFTVNPKSGRIKKHNKVSVKTPSNIVWLPR